MWSECRDIYFILVALEVRSRNCCVLHWHKSKQTNKKNPTKPPLICGNTETRNFIQPN